MKSQDLTYTFTVDQSPEEVFAAINNVRGWWSGDITGETGKLGAVFTYRHKDVHMSKHKITEFIPSKKVVWLVMDSYLSFVEDKTEWNGSRVVFEIAKQGNQTQVRFTHAGLSSQHQCFDACSNAWGSYVNGSLRNLIAAGKGNPNKKESPDRELAVR